MLDMTASETVLALDTIERAVDDIAAGRPVVVVDDPGRENEGDVVLAAEAATAEQLAFMVRHTSGYVCAPMEGAELDRLRLPLMVQSSADLMRTAYAVSVDARHGVTTGISAADRARTIATLADPASSPDDFVRPGHVLPLRAREGGVLRRAGHTEAAVDLTRLAGCRPAAAICELANDDGTMRRLPELRRFARDHGLALVSIADLIAYRRRHEPQVDQTASVTLETGHGAFRAVTYRSRIGGAEHLALVQGEVEDGRQVLVRVQHECLAGDVFSSRCCECRANLSTSLDAIAGEGRGIFLYLRESDRQHPGLAARLGAHDAGAEASCQIGATSATGLAADTRDYDLAAQMLMQLGVQTVRLLTDSSAEYAALEACGLELVAQEQLRGRGNAASHLTGDDLNPRRVRGTCAAGGAAWWGR